MLPLPSILQQDGIPISNPITLDPTATTSPADSCPMIYGCSIFRCAMPPLFQRVRSELLCRLEMGVDSWLEEFWGVRYHVCEVLTHRHHLPVRGHAIRRISAQVSEHWQRTGCSLASRTGLDSPSMRFYRTVMGEAGRQSVRRYINLELVRHPAVESYGGSEQHG